MEVAETIEAPCSWCLGHSAKSCSCNHPCGEPECPSAERPLHELQPVPEFASLVDALAAQAKATTNPKPVQGEPEVTDAGAALARILLLHKRCPCKVCAEGTRVPSCKGCNEWYPCPTVRAVRDPLNRIPAV